MSSAMAKMWISFAAMGFMFLSIILILLSRYKLKKKFFRIVTALVAYALLIYSGIIIFIIVFSGPTIE